jgi:hypothetical protein
MFKYIVLGTALLLAVCAALFSITGIVSLFSGAMIAVGMMACAIELGKLTTISLLYRHYNDLSKTLRRYLIGALCLASAITTVGIYGYLSSAYATAASTIQGSENRITLATSQQTSIDAQIKRQTDRITQLQAYRGQQENRLDKLVGHRGLKDQQTAVANADKELQSAQNTLTMLSNRRDSLEVAKTQLHTDITSNGHLGSFYYIASALGVKLDSVVKWFILVIVLVFDPLSISLLLAYNVILKKEKECAPEPKVIIPEEIPEIEPLEQITEIKKDKGTHGKVVMPEDFVHSEEQLKAGVRNT